MTEKYPKEGSRETWTFSFTLEPISSKTLVDFVTDIATHMGEGGIVTQCCADLFLCLVVWNLCHSVERAAGCRCVSVPVFWLGKHGLSKLCQQSGEDRDG